MKKSFFKEDLPTGKKVLAVLFLFCMLLFFGFTVCMFVGVFIKNSTVMWTGVIGVGIISLLGALIIKMNK